MVRTSALSIGVDAVVRSLAKGFAMSRSTLITAGIDYPDSDGQPMAETDFQRDVMTYAIETLKIHFREREAVYVSGDLFIYYEEGNRAAALTPDVFVVFGVPNHPRRTYSYGRRAGRRTS